MSSPTHYEKGILVFQKREVSVLPLGYYLSCLKGEVGLTITSAVQETVLW